METAVNSLFRLKEVVKENVVIKDMNKKFAPFTIKECVDALEVGKRITLPYNFTEECLKWLQHDLRIMLKDYKDQNIIELTKLEERDYGDMNKWSFVLITQGKRDNLVEEFVRSVWKQYIPFFEIIIVGATKEKNYERWKNVKHIPFTEQDARGWITKKKNVGCEAAKYMNMLVVHDDVVLADDWWVRMQKWGNNFECANMTIDNRPTLAWFSEVNGFNQLLSVGDYNENYYIGGHVMGIKKWVWEIVKWDEKVFYGQREDVIMTRALQAAGFLPRVAEGGIRLLG